MSVTYKILELEGDYPGSHKLSNRKVLHTHTFVDENEAAEYMVFWHGHPDLDGNVLEVSFEDALRDVESDISLNGCYQYEGEHDIMILNKWLFKRNVDKNIDNYVQE